MSWSWGRVLDIEESSKSQYVHERKIDGERERERRRERTKKRVREYVRVVGAK